MLKQLSYLHKFTDYGYQCRHATKYIRRSHRGKVAPASSFSQKVAMFREYNELKQIVFDRTSNNDARLHFGSLLSSNKKEESNFALHKTSGLHPSHPVPSVHHSPRAIPEIDISETYFVKEASLGQLTDESRGSKSRKKLPFLVKKKKTPNELARKATDDIGLSYEEAFSDAIVAYNDLVPEDSQRLDQRSLNPVVLSELATLKLHDKQYAQNDHVKERLKYIIQNYRQPPAYPGHTSIDSRPSILQQLLQEQANMHLKDNASMINYMQVDLPSGLSNEDLTKIIKTLPEESGNDGSDHKGSHKDKLVMRTRSKVFEQPAQVKVKTGPISPSQLFEQRQKYYHEQYTDNSFNSTATPPRNGKHIGEALSEYYPRDYDVQGPAQGYPSEGGHFQHDLDLPSYIDSRTPHFESVDYMNQAYGIPNFEDDQTPSFNYLQRRTSQTYVPPSPYLNADVPEWLQVYARASPELDQYLKWDMFRYPELDCWQTMLKRLYKKELEQIVMWFEEYRQALSKELETRRRSMGMLPSKRSTRKVLDPQVRKTDV